MVFLMGLNESCANIRAQILLMDLIPSINKVFSLLIQEERQRAIGINTPSFNSMAMAASEVSKRNTTNQFHRKDTRSFCTHCGLRGHVIDKCYRLHGYPPGYRTNNHVVARPYLTPASSYSNRNVASSYSNRNAVSSYSNSNAAANQVYEKNNGASSFVNNQSSVNLPTFFNSLSSNKYSQLMEMLQFHLQAAKPKNITPTISHVAGQVTIEDDWQG